MQRFLRFRQKLTDGDNDQSIQSILDEKKDLEQEVDRYLLTNDPEMKGSLGLDTEKFNIRNLDTLLMASGSLTKTTRYSKESLYVIDAPKDDIELIL